MGGLQLSARRKLLLHATHQARGRSTTPRVGTGDARGARKTDGLILDVRMAGMTGLELQRHLVANHAEMPIIFITAHGDEEMRLRALKGGAVDYLLKPFSEEGLLKAVQRALAPE